MDERDYKAMNKELQEEPKCLTKLELAKNIAAIGIGKEEPKQETLEEANWKVLGTKNDTFYIGAKWVQKKMYSEEDLREAFRQGQDNMDYSDTYGWDSKLTEQEWFEQFKKK